MRLYKAHLTAWFLHEFLKCSRQEWEVFPAFGAEFIVEDEASSVEFDLQWLLTRNDVMITAGAGRRNLLDVHLSASCNNQLDAFSLEVGLHVFCRDTFPPGGPDHDRQDILTDGTFDPVEAAINLLNDRSDDLSY